LFSGMTYIRKYTPQRLHQITVVSYGDYIFIITLKVSVCAEYPLLARTAQESSFNRIMQT
jgi:hypothetical protein